MNSVLAIKLEALWDKHRDHLIFLIMLGTVIISLVTSQSISHISHGALMATTGSTPPPNNVGGGGPWS